MDDVTGGNEGTAGDQSIEDQDPAQAGGDESGNPGSNPEGQPQGDQLEEGVVDIDGKKMVPYDAFKARIDKLTAQRHEAESRVLDQILNDPNAIEKFRKLVREETNKPVDASEGKEAGDADPLPNFRKWRSSIQDPAWGNLLDNLVGSLIPDIDTGVQSYVQSAIQEAMAPYKSYVERDTTDRFFSKYPDAKAYESQILQEMKESKVPIEKAWKIVGYEHAVKIGRNAQTKGQPNTQPKAPITGGGNSPAANTRTKAKTLDEGINRAMTRLGIK